MVGICVSKQPACGVSQTGHVPHFVWMGVSSRSCLALMLASGQPVQYYRQSRCHASFTDWCETTWVGSWFLRVFDSLRGLYLVCMNLLHVVLWRASSDDLAVPIALLD